MLGYDTSFGGWLVLAALLHLADHLTSDLERVHSRGDTNVNHRVPDCFRDLLFRQSVVDRTPYVCRQLWATVQRHKDANVEQRPLLSLQSWPAPASPTHFRNILLSWFCKWIRALSSVSQGCYAG
jgi:hypothetical protein